MATQNASDQNYANNSDGWQLAGGTTARQLTVTGANITLTGAGTNVYTFPATTDTLAAIAATQTLTNKDVSSSTNTFPSGFCVQMVSTNSTAEASGTTVIPNDNTIPQNTEGDQYMTQAITPKATTNNLLITVRAFVSNSAVNDLIMALFQDSTANALAACMTFQGTAGVGNLLMITYEMAAGTTSATTFKVRTGGSVAGTTTFNGTGGAGKFGGITLSNITIQEFKV